MTLSVVVSRRVGLELTEHITQILTLLRWLQLPLSSRRTEAGRLYLEQLSTPCTAGRSEVRYLLLWFLTASMAAVKVAAAGGRCLSRRRGRRPGDAGGC